jgi:hypothetical protein
VVVSRHTELLRDAGATTSELHRIPPGTDATVSGDTAKGERPTIVTVSRLNQRYKGHDVMIRALAEIRERVPDVQWIVIGDGELRSEYERLAAAEGLQQHVRFLGAVSDSERDAWLGSGHVFAMPSRLPPNAGGEGFGIVFLGAAAHGLPVVAGAVAGARDAVVDGETGILVDPTDESAVAAAISELLGDTARAESLGRRGADRARDFAWARGLPAGRGSAAGSRCKVNVLFVNHTCLRSGAEESLLNLMAALPPEVSPTLACPAGPLATAAADLGVPVMSLPEIEGSLRCAPRPAARVTRLVQSRAVEGPDRRY